ncbi:MAG: hypothetical protein ORN57_01720, partial [Alphaproteobacteria bacterium]|nr:hypothetical protein [Alphaproteobacteria bacterium]
QLPAIIARGFDPEVKAAMLARLAPVFTAITATRQSLPTNKDLIGFAGAPFTLACYMIEGRSVPGFPRTLAWAQAQPAPFARLMDILTQAVISFLQAQKKSGADIVKIFDSWSALIPHDLHEVALYAPHRLIVATPNLTPLITFPKGFPHGHTDLVAYQQQTQARIIAIDHHRPMAEVAQQLPKDIILQGNLDPQLLRIGGAAMKQAVEQQLDTMAQLASPYIFNLGHGIDKTTPPDHVAQLINIIQQYQPTS